MAVDTAQDPFYSTWPRLYAGLCYFINNQMNEAEGELNKVVSYMQKSGCEIFGPAALPFLGAISINKGDMSHGQKMIEDIRNSSIEKIWGFGIAMSEYVLGNLYFQIAYGEKPGSLSIIRNVGFLAKNVPFASKRAESYLKTAVESAKRFGAKGILGLTYIDLGRLYRIKKKNTQARECILEAANIFEQIDGQVFLKKTRDILEDLG